MLIAIWKRGVSLCKHRPKSGSHTGARVLSIGGSRRGTLRAPRELEVKVDEFKLKLSVAGHTRTRSWILTSPFTNLPPSLSLSLEGESKPGLQC